MHFLLLSNLKFVWNISNSLRKKKKKHRESVCSYFKLYFSPRTSPSTAGFLVIVMFNERWIRNKANSNVLNCVLLGKKSKGVTTLGKILLKYASLDSSSINWQFSQKQSDFQVYIWHTLKKALKRLNYICSQTRRQTVPCDHSMMNSALTFK